jgi:hypothetical protein
MERDEALQRLRAVEERLMLTLAAGNVGLWEWFPQTGAFVWDDWLHGLWNLGPSDQATFEAFVGGILPADRGLVRAAIDRAFDPTSGGVYEVVFRLAKASRVRWILARGRCSFDEQRRPSRFVGTLLDVTEREEMREVAQAHARRAEAWGGLASRLLQARSLEASLQAICEESVAALGVTMSAIFLLDESSREAFCAYIHGAPPGVVPPSLREEQLREHFARHGPVVQFPDVILATDLPNYESFLRAGIRSHASVILAFEGIFLGALVVASVGEV